MELSVAKGCMQHIADAKPENILVNLGIAPETLELLTGSIPWTGNQRVDIKRCMDALNHGVCDIVGIPRINVPAEFIAASIAKFVHPCNTQLACNWAQITAGVLELAGGNTKSQMQETITADKLFSMVQMLQDHVRQPYLNVEFELAVKKAVDNYMGEPV